MPALPSALIIRLRPMTMIDTSTQVGRDKRIDEIAKGYMASGNKHALVGFLGLSDSDFDISPADHGEEPSKGRRH